MKKITIVLVAVILLLGLPVQPAAASGFSLVNGQLATQDQDLREDDHSLKDFFKALQIAADGSPQPDKHALSETSLSWSVWAAWFRLP